MVLEPMMKQKRIMETVQLPSAPKGSRDPHRAGSSLFESILFISVDKHDSDQAILIHLAVHLI
jgi:hypothetical protein